MGQVTIPKVFHRIWFGGPEPAEHRPWAASWLRLHPDWELRTWTEENLPALRNQASFDAAVQPAQRSDIARYELLERFGGVYLDCDFEALKPIDELLGGVTFFCASEDEVWLSIGIIGCVPGDAVMRTVIAELPASVTRNAGRAINVQTGPQFFTRVVNAARSGRDPQPVTVFPSALFYPYHFSEPEREGDDFPDAYAIHHWGHGWTS